MDKFVVKQQKTSDEPEVTLPDALGILTRNVFKFVDILFSSQLHYCMHYAVWPWEAKCGVVSHAY